MTRLDANYLEFSTYVDYSEPKISFITGKPIDNTKLIADCSNSDRLDNIFDSLKKQFDKNSN